MDRRIDEAIQSLIAAAKEEDFATDLAVGVSFFDELNDSWRQQFYGDVDTIFDVASVTKSVVTSSLALWLISKGKLSLESRVVNFVPDLAIPDAATITIWHLLSFGVSFDLTLSELARSGLGAAQLRRAILTAPSRFNPGENYAYINSTSIVLGWVIEAVTSQKLDELFEEVFAKELTMKDTFFAASTVTQEKFERIAPTEIRAGQTIQGQVHDESAATFQAAEQAIGSAGLFSTASDLLAFLEMVIDEYSGRSQQFFKSQQLQQIADDQLPDHHHQVGLGWELNRGIWMPLSGNNAAQHKQLGKTGFTGCCVWIDLDNQVCGTILSNNTYPQRPKSTARRNQLFKEVLSQVNGKGTDGKLL